MPDIVLPSRCAYPGHIESYTDDDLEQIPRSPLRYGGAGLTREQQGLQLATPPSLDVLTLPGLLVWFETDYGLYQGTTPDDGTESEENNDTVGLWLDRSGNDNHYLQSTEAARPTVQNVSQGAADFLAVKTENNKFLSLGTRLTTVKQIYIVTRHATGTGDYQPILGDSVGFDFHGGEGTALYLGGLGTNVADGEGWINGENHPAMCWESMEKPMTYSVITNVTKNSANVATDRLTRDRDQANRYWNGFYTAVILCSSVHDTDTMNLVHEYLAEKYGITLV